MSQSVSATAKNVRMSPRKIGEVAALIRGRTVADARVILEHTPRRAAEPVAKAINSAAANAVNNAGLTDESLVISEISIGQGLSLKRYRPAAHGRALPYRKRSANISVTLEGLEKPKPVKKSSKKSAANKETPSKSSAKKETA